jgi:hypothetical protein
MHSSVRLASLADVLVAQTIARVRAVRTSAMETTVRPNQEQL